MPTDIVSRDVHGAIQQINIRQHTCEIPHVLLANRVEEVSLACFQDEVNLRMLNLS